MERDPAGDAFGLPIANIIQLVASELASPVTDETKLTVTFDAVLRWTNDVATGDDAPVLATAIREQLGLRLERRSNPLEVVWDRPNAGLMRPVRIRRVGMAGYLVGPPGIEPGTP